MTEVEFLKRVETIPPLPIANEEVASAHDHFFSTMQSPVLDLGDLTN